MVIDSSANKKVQFLRKLADRSERRAAGCFIVEGQNILKDLPPEIRPHSVFVAQSKADELMDFAVTFGCSVTILSDRIFNSVSDTVTPAGILAVMPIPQSGGMTRLAERVLVLDRIADAGNLGTIIRTAAAFGYRDLLLINCADAYSGKAVRSSMGGIFRTRIIEADYEGFSKAVNHPVYILDMAGEDISKADAKGRFALVIGSEAHGVSDFFRSVRQKSLAIPMEGDMESLNAAVSAAIAMYELSK